MAAVDLSPEMVRIARDREAELPLAISYEVLDAARLGDRFEPGTFDLVTACMSLQDMPDVPAVLQGTADLLRPGGRLVSCNSHPCSNTLFREWHYDATGEKRGLIIADYFDEVTVEYEWSHPRMPRPIRTQANHVPLQRWFEWVFEAGFLLRGFHEPRPTDEAFAKRPELLDARLVPYFAIFDLVNGALGYESLSASSLAVGSSVDGSAAAGAASDRAAAPR